MKKFSSKPQAPGLRADGEANRALRRAYAKGKPWAHAAVQEAAGNLGRAVAALSLAFGWTGTDDTDDEDAEPQDQRVRASWYDEVAK